MDSPKPCPEIQVQAVVK